jgi:hypothetical protein
MLLWFYIFSHPILILCLHFLDNRSFPHNYSISQYLMSNSSIVVQLTIIITLIIMSVEKEWYKYLRILWFISYLVGIEALIFFYLLRGTSLHNLVIEDGYTWFTSVFLRSKVLAGLLGFFSIAFPLYFAYLNRLKYRYIFSIVLGILTVIAAQERSLILSSLIFLIGYFLLRLSTLNLKYFLKVQLLIISVLFLLIPIVVGVTSISNSIRGHSSLSMSSSFDRLARYARGYDLFINFFPVGAGTNMDVKYMFFSDIKSPTLSNLDQWSYNNGYSELQQQTGKILSWVNDSNKTNWESVHSTYLELLINFGLAGIIVAWLSVWYPAKYIFLSLKYKKFVRKDKYLQAGSIYAIFLLSIDLAINFLSYGQSIWLICPLHIAFYNLHYKDFYQRYFFQKPQKIILKMV